MGEVVELSQNVHWELLLNLIANTQSHYEKHPCQHVLITPIECDKFTNPPLKWQIYQSDWMWQIYQMF